AFSRTQTSFCTERRGIPAWSYEQITLEGVHDGALLLDQRIERSISKAFGTLVGEPRERGGFSRDSLTGRGSGRHVARARDSHTVVTRSCCQPLEPEPLII